jgi:hypothetical protein
MAADPAASWVDDDSGDGNDDQNGSDNNHVVVAVSAMIAPPIPRIVVNQRRTRNKRQETRNEQWKDPRQSA